MDKIKSAQQAVANARRVVAQQQQQQPNKMDQLQQSVNKSMNMEGPSALEEFKAWLKSLIDKATNEQALSHSVSEGLKHLQNQQQK